MNWSDLSMSQRSELMQIYLKNGITSLDEMKKHYNSFAEGGSIDDPPYRRYYATPQYGFSPESSDLNTYNLEQQVAKETAAKKAKSEKERRERFNSKPTYIQQDTKTSFDKQNERDRVNQASTLAPTIEAQNNFMSLGRPNTESVQQAVQLTPQIGPAMYSYFRNANIARELGYFVPGVSNVLMAQDANTLMNNGENGLAILSAVGALSPVVGMTLNFKSPARYTRPANKIGDWTIIEPKSNLQKSAPEISRENLMPLSNNGPLQLIDGEPTRALQTVEPVRTLSFTQPAQLEYTPKLQLNSPRPRLSKQIKTPEKINLPEKFVNFVNKEGAIDEPRFRDFWKYIAEQYGTGEIYERELEHSLQVAKSAQELPLPKGISRKDYVQAALLHDIGKAIEGKAKTHGKTGANILKRVAGTQLSPAQYEAIEKHMDNTSYGKRRALLKAVEFADAARGKTLAQSLTLHPNLLTYDYEPLFNITGSDRATQSFREDLKTRVNPILKQTALGTIPLDSSIEEASALLNDKTRQWRTLIRGARDPEGSSINFLTSQRNAENAEILARRYYGDALYESNPAYYRALVSTTTIPLDPTGSGRSGFADVIEDKHGFYTHKQYPGGAAQMLDIDLNLYDALYASNSIGVGKGYKEGTGTRHGRVGLARKVYLPFEEYNGEALPSEWMLNNFDWDLLDATSKSYKSGIKNFGLTRFSQFDIPYRLQTGRSFLSDYTDYVGKSGVLQYPKQRSIPQEISETFEEKLKEVNSINSVLDKYGIKHINPFNEDGSIIYRVQKNNDLAQALKMIEKLPDMAAVEMTKPKIQKLPVAPFSNETVDVMLPSNPNFNYRHFANHIATLRTLGILSDAQVKKARYITFDKKQLIKKALDIYYTKNKPIYKPNKEFLDQSNMMEFMLNRGLQPRVLNPNYLSTIAVNTGGTSLPEGSPLFFSPKRHSNQLSIIAPKGEKVFEDLGDIDLDNILNTSVVGKRHDFGIRGLDITTKFGRGGKLDTPPERFFGIATPEVTDNNIYYSRNSLLPEINITAKGDPRKVNNDYYKAHSRARADLQYNVQTAPGWQLATLGAALPAAFMLAPTVLPAVGKVLTNPLVDVALTTHGAITAPKNIVEGINEIKAGNYDKGALDLGLTALDLIGAGNLIGRPARLLSKNFRRNLAYRTIFPYDYSFSPKDAKDILKGIWNKQYSPKDIQHVHENHPLRAAAFRKYLGLEDDITKKLFVPRSDETFNIDPEVAVELNKNVGINTLTGSPLQNLYKGYKRDNIYDIMGGLGGSEVYSLGNRGVFRMTDTWDLQPFKTFEGSPKVRLAHDIENLGTKIRQYTYDKSLLKPVDKLAEKMQYAGDYIKVDKSGNSWLRNFEITPKKCYN